MNGPMTPFLGNLSSPSKNVVTQDGVAGSFDSTSGVHQRCPPQDPDKLDQLQMKLDHLLEQETNLLLPLKRISSTVPAPKGS
ncbi:hypothetical protein Tco_0361195 [Tanacetum coccineum]